MTQEENLRNQIALGWVLELLILTVMLLFATIESILMDNNFMTLRLDPGQSIKWMVYLVAVLALMPACVFLVHGWRLRPGRWVGVVLSVLSFLYFLLHHLAHWEAGQRPDAASHVLDVT
ncbi:MAG TPA: hypothetical protein DD490_14425, partial [Acidobacteria bacterium]|nr:hypothetical protein [Acidobacteriota bacterium]